MSDDNKLDKIMKYLENMDKRISNIEDTLSTRKQESSIAETPPKNIREESFVEFFKKFHSEKETDKTLVIMRFLELKKGIMDITTKDISNGFREVRVPIPRNVADKIQMLHKKGLIEPGNAVEGLKGWKITQSGLDYLKELKNETNKKK